MDERCVVQIVAQIRSGVVGHNAGRQHTVVVVLRINRGHRGESSPRSPHTASTRRLGLGLRGLSPSPALGPSLGFGFALARALCSERGHDRGHAQRRAERVAAPAARGWAHDTQILAVHAHKLTAAALSVGVVVVAAVVTAVSQRRGVWSGDRRPSLCVDDPAARRDNTAGRVWDGESGVVVAPGFDVEARDALVDAEVDEHAHGLAVRTASANARARVRISSVTCVAADIRVTFDVVVDGEGRHGQDLTGTHSHMRRQHDLARQTRHRSIVNYTGAGTGAGISTGLTCTRAATTAAAAAAATAAAAPGGLVACGEREVGGDAGAWRQRGRHDHRTRARTRTSARRAAAAAAAVGAVFSGCVCVCVGGDGRVREERVEVAEDVPRGVVDNAAKRAESGQVQVHGARGTRGRGGAGRRACWQGGAHGVALSK